MAKLTEKELHDRVGMDLAKHAGDRASKVMLDALSLCDSRAQATMVAIQVLGIIAAQAFGVIGEHTDLGPDARASDMLDILADIMREVEPPAGRRALVEER